MKFSLSRGTILYIILSCIGSFWAVYYYNSVPAYTDAYYHMNGAISLASGEGFTDNVLWTYIAAPDSLPAPSHLYWMPGTSIISSFGTFLFGINYSAAQVGLALSLWAAMLLAYWLGWYLGGTARHAWMAGILTLFAGFFTDMWGQTDTFAPYAFFGGSALVFIGLGISQNKHNLRYWIMAGVLAACGHLVRSDGLILLLVGYCVLLYPFNLKNYRKRILWILPFTLAYILVMSPWFLRNLNEIGTILPTGGTQNAWFTSYNELFNFPPAASPSTLFADGIDAFVQSRLFATVTNNGIPLQGIVYQGAIIFFPFIVLGLWRRRHVPFMRGIWIFAVGIHLAFALVFPYAGVRGGFWHAVASLVPIWAVVGLLGLDDFIEVIAKRRKRWKPSVAKPLLSSGLVLMTIVLSLQISTRNISDDDIIALALVDIVPADARVMLNDPSQLYYYTGIESVTIPNETPDIALEIANIYDIDYLLLVDGELTEPMKFEEIPEFLIPIDFPIEEAHLYAFDRD